MSSTALPELPVSGPITSSRVASVDESTLPALDVSNLSKVFPNGRGIHNLSFTVERGEIFGLLGPNGAGKTTTIRTVLDFIRPTAGVARFFGVDAQGRPDVRRRVGFLPGDLTLRNRITGREWLAFQSRLKDSVDWELTNELGERFGADLDEPLRNLSTGNRRKIGLVNAFMHAPDLVILDEPTAGLDPIVRQEFYRLVTETRASGRTVLLSSHVLPEVERVCDRVAIIKAGELAAIEKIADLKSRALRKLEIRFAEQLPEQALRDVEGVRAVEANGSSAHVTVAGSIDPLIKALAQFEITDLISHEPNLEEEFLSFYEEGGNDEQV
ncbi:MAG: ABC transporter ATP-binding protein [Chloroflexi bacterium]|nr:ABC transporter ATP-binding protein [Chloroflexota bacterium]